MQPGLDRSFRTVEAFGERLPAHAVEIRETHHLPLVGLEPFETAHEALHVLAPPDRLDRMLVVARDLVELRHVGSRAVSTPAHLVERPIAHDGRHPRDGRRELRIEVAGPLPNLEETVLDHVLRRLSAAQDTQRHGIEFRTGGLVKRRERRLVPARHTGQEVIQLLRR